MNTFSDKVVSLRPADDHSLRHLTLVVGNQARNAGSLLADIEVLAADLTASGVARAQLATAAGHLAIELEDTHRQAERCLGLWREIAAL